MIDFDNLTVDEYADAIVASSAVPVLFPFSEFKGEKLMDMFSVKWNLNIASAIDKCLEIVDDESQITLDVIMMYPDRVAPIDKKDAKSYSAISNWLRAHSF